MVTTLATLLYGVYVMKSAAESGISFHFFDIMNCAYWVLAMCSLAAAVQGMDETVNNGAQAIYLKVR